MKHPLLLWISLSLFLTSACSTLPFSPTRSEPSHSAFSLTKEAAILRAKQVQHVSYDLQFDLTGDPESFSAITKIGFELKPEASQLSPSLLIDLEGGTLQKLLINNTEVAGDEVASLFNGHQLQVPIRLLKESNASSELKPVNNLIEIHYQHPYSHEGHGLHRFTDPQDQRVYLYSDFEPYHAHLLFPCMDQPDLKAHFSLQVKAPRDWEVISHSSPETPRTEGKNQIWKFKKTPILSTYVFALHAGPYAVWSKTTPNGIPIRLLARQSLASYVDHAEWLRITERGLDYFSVQFGTPYPFQKYDQIIVPEFNAGAMENAAAVTFSENFIYRTPVTENRRRARADTILHEMAHMWFGDLVTLRWWNGLWLNESFASYMSSKAVDAATEYPGTWQAFFASMKQWAYWEDQLVTTHPVEVPIPTTEHADSIFDGITYGKGAAALKQLNYYIGEDDFREGLQRYFLKYAYKNTSLHDFFEMQQEASGVDLLNWQRLWLQTPGVNTLRAQWSCEKDPETQESIIKDFSLLQGGPPGTPLRPHRTLVGLYSSQPLHRHSKHPNSSSSLEPRITLEAHYSEASHYLDEAKGKPCPDLVFPNLNDHDYVKVELDPLSIQTLFHSMEKISDPLTRQMLWHTLWEMVMDGQLSALDLAQTLLQHLPHEQDTLILSHNLRRLSDPSLRATTLLKILPAAERKTIQSQIEKMAFDEFKASRSGSDPQLIWFQAFLNHASQEASLQYLQKLLEGKIKLPGFKMDPERRWKIIEALARQGISGIQTLITQEQKNDPTDMGKTSALLAEVQIPHPEVKQKWSSLFSEFPHLDLSLSKLRVATSSFRVLGQEALLQVSDEHFFSTLETLIERRTVEADQYAATFARGMYPSLCQDTVVQKTAHFLKTHKDLSPLITKTLKVYQQEEERCIRARALIHSKNTTEVNF